MPRLFRIGLALVVASFLGGLLTYWITLSRSPSLPSHSNLLGCREVVEIARWGKERYGNPRVLDVQSKAFGKRVAQTYIAKLDPKKILLLRGESEKFVQEFQAHWTSMLEYDCSWFDSWVAREYPRISTRFWKTFEAVAPKHASAKKKSANLTENHSSTETTLRARVLESLTQLASEAPSNLLAGFNGDMRSLLKDSLEDQVGTENVSSSYQLLAKAMLSGYDRYSTYFSEEEFDDFYHELIGENSGVGIRVRKVVRGLLIENILKDSPAGKSGALSEGDIIVRVDGKSTLNVPRKDIKALLKGKKDTSIRFDVVHAGSEEIESITLERKAYRYEDAKIRMKIRTPKLTNAGVALIEIPSFYGHAGMGKEESNASCSRDLKRALERLRKNSKVKGVVLDLRGNPGGFLEEAVTMGSYFLGARTVVGVVEQGRRRVLKENSPILYTGPLVVLVDQESASAAEVLAGALKDHGRALVLGPSSTYGKGTVQRLFHLGSEWSLTDLGFGPQSGVAKLTTSLFYSPSGHSPENGGIVPHTVIGKRVPRRSKPVPSAAFPETAPFFSATERIDADNASHLLDEMLQNWKTTAQLADAGLEENSVELVAAMSSHLTPDAIAR